jgi:hypothetical protein
MIRLDFKRGYKPYQCQMHATYLSREEGGEQRSTYWPGGNVCCFGGNVFFFFSSV